MRLFIAIPLSNEVKTSLVKLQKTLPEGIRRQPDEQIHITLRFLGETSIETAYSVENKLDEIEAGAFTLSIKEVNTFPQKGKPKIIWAGVQKTEPLINLQKEIENVCVNSGFKPEERSYIPHITIGKVKKASRKKVKNWRASNENWKGTNLQVNKFILFESKPKGGGVIHESIKSYKLQ